MGRHPQVAVQAQKVAQFQTKEGMESIEEKMLSKLCIFIYYHTTAVKMLTWHICDTTIPYYTGLLYY